QMTSPTAPSDPNLKPPTAGGSNWDLGNSSVRNRLAEDIATLQANLDALPLSPEVTGGTSHKKSKQPASRHPPENPVTPKADLPHMTPCVPAEPAPRSHRQQEQPASQLAPTPEEIAAVKLAKEMHDFEAPTSESVFTSSVPPSALATNVDGDMFDVSAFLAEIDHSEWVDALNFYAITANKCWQCGGYNHYARNCPDKSRVGTGGKAMGQPLGTIFGTIYGTLPSGLPISSERFPQMVHRKSLTPPSRNQEHARDQQPLSVAPQASAKGGVSAQIMDIGDVPDNLDTLGFYNMDLGEDLVSDVAVFDTGASHGFTGSKSLLHDFRPLSKPIGVFPESAPLSPTISPSSVSAAQSPSDVISRSFPAVHDLMSSPNSYTPFSSQPGSNAISMLASKTKTPPSTILDVMAADLIGPFQVDSIEGGKFLLTMQDVATGYAFVLKL
ncbi:hypothetical protein PSHT_08148, partial [Puccinia striiformis]